MLNFKNFIEYLKEIIFTKIYIHRWWNLIILGELFFTLVKTGLFTSEAAIVDK